MRTKQQMPNLNNATPASIVDDCAPLTEEMNRLKKLTDYYKSGLKARLSPELRIDPLTYQVEGDQYGATISEGTQVRFSVDKLKELNLLSEEQINSCYVEGEPFLTVRFYKIESAKNAS